MSIYIDGQPTSTTLGGTASGTIIHKIGFGCMMMTWTPNPTPDEQAFEAIKAAIDLIPPNEKLFLNSGEFYGQAPRNRTTNLELLARFFAKYPQLADRVFLSVKGGTEAGSLEPDGSKENIQRSVDAIVEALGGKKKLDLFQCARRDPKYQIEEIIENIKTAQGDKANPKFNHIGVSEVSAATLQKAAAVHGIAAVEIEVSPWAYEDETKRVIAAAQELDIPVIAYAPLGRGFLTGKVKREDLPEGDFRRNLVKFQEKAQAANEKVVGKLTEIASKKGVSNAQLSIAWVSSLGANMVPLPGTSKASRVKENFDAANIKFSEEELNAINGLLSEFEGERYFGGGNAEALWG